MFSIHICFFSYFVCWPHANYGPSVNKESSFTILFTFRKYLFWGPRPKKCLSVCMLWSMLALLSTVVFICQKPGSTPWLEGLNIHTTKLQCTCLHKNCKNRFWGRGWATLWKEGAVFNTRTPIFSNNAQNQCFLVHLEAPIRKFCPVVAPY